MENNHKLTLYVSYYLSRFNDLALKNLKYKTWSIAFEDISEKLKVNPHSVKNWRDEFDPLHGHRAGWYQRPMSPSRVKVAKALEDLEEEVIRGIVIDILSGNIINEPENLNSLTSIIADDKREKETFTLRGPTGKKAEEFFIQYHKETALPISGELEDTRDLGCGYDFQIKGSNKYFIEVKGLAKKEGGILFTDKEWNTAKEYKSNYILVLVSNIDGEPKIQFLEDPYNNLKAKKNVITSIQVQWTVSPKEIGII